MNRLPPKASPGAFLALCAAAITLGCSSARERDAKVDASAPAIRIDGQDIPYQEFEAYLEASLGGETPPPQDDETRSRLLDQFIEERLLLREARNRRISVSDEKVESYLVGLGVGVDAGQAGKPADAALREQIRQNLLIEEFKSQVLLRDLQILPEETEEYYRQHPDEFREARMVVLRQILLEDVADARKLLSQLRADPTQFQPLAERHSASPDRGQSRPYEEEDLPEPIRTTVFSLAPGEISDVVGEGGRYRIFQVVEKHEGQNQNLEEARKRIEVLLLQRKVQEALARALAEARRSSRIEVLTENLPFRYVGEYRG